MFDGDVLKGSWLSRICVETKLLVDVACSGLARGYNQ